MQAQVFVARQNQHLCLGPTAGTVCHATATFWTPLRHLPTPTSVSSTLTKRRCVRTRVCAALQANAGETSAGHAPWWVARFHMRTTPLLLRDLSLPKIPEARMARSKVCTEVFVLVVSCHRSRLATSWNLCSNGKVSTPPLYLSTREPTFSSSASPFINPVHISLMQLLCAFVNFLQSTVVHSWQLMVMVHLRHPKLLYTIFFDSDVTLIIINRHMRVLCQNEYADLWINTTIPPFLFVLTC